MSEHLLIDQCAPTLAGMKTGSLFLCGDAPQVLHGELQDLNRRFSGRGLRVLPLRVGGGKSLVYVYRPRQLARDLRREGARQILAGLNYPLDNPAGCVATLRNRLADREEFPHEIGLFLGYPPEDVAGFIAHGARDAKCTGYWKVYGDPEQAEKVFASFRRCTRCYQAAYANRVPMESLVVRC